MKSYDLVLASGAEHLRESFEQLGFRVISSGLNHDNKRFFPNSDLYTQLSNLPRLSDRRVIVIQSCTGATPALEEFFTTSDRVQELILICDLLKNPLKVEKIGHKKYNTKEIAPPKSVEVVLTLQPFALQDKAFQTGETDSCRCVMQQIARFCDKIWIVAPVVDKSLSWVQDLLKMGMYEEIEIVSEMIEFAAKKFEFDDYLLTTPDEGAQNRFGFPGFKKVRTDSFKIEMSGDLNVEGKNVIVVDDLTKSGTTLLRAANLFYEQGAAKVGLVVLHVTPIRDHGELLFEELITKIHNRVVVSNTVYSVAFCQKNPELVYNIAEKVTTILGISN